MNHDESGNELDQQQEKKRDTKEIEHAVQYYIRNICNVYLRKPAYNRIKRS